MKVVKNAYLHLGNLALFEVKDDNNLPIFQWVDLWNGQTEYVGDDGACIDDFPLPALFMEFDIPKIDQIGKWQDDSPCIITCYVAFETLSDSNIGSSQNPEALLFFDYMDAIHSQFGGYTNEACGSLSRGSMRRYKTRSNLIVYTMTYETTLRDSAAFARRDTVTTVMDLDVSIEKRPHQTPDKNGSGETYFDLT